MRPLGSARSASLRRLRSRSSDIVVYSGLLIRSMQLPRAPRSDRLNHKSLVCAYNAHVRSVLEYGCTLWAGAAMTHLKRLERIQHKFLMWLAAKSNKPLPVMDYDRLLDHFNMRSIKARLAYYDLIFIYNLFHERLDAPDLIPAFGLNVPGRATRAMSLWAVPYGRVNTVQRSLYCRIPVSCNMFLNARHDIDLFTSTHFSFKSAVQKHSCTLGTNL